MKKQTVIKILGNIVTVLALIFMGYKIMKEDVDFSVLLSPGIILAIVLLSLLLATNVHTNSVAWQKLIEMLSGKKVNKHEILHVYAKSNIAKYLPGNFMHYASRNLIGAKYNISQKDMIISTILEIILKVISAFVLVIVLVQSDFQSVMNQIQTTLHINPTLIYAVIGGLILLVVGFCIVWARKFMKGRLRIWPLFFAFLCHILVFITQAAAFIIMANILVKNQGIYGVFYMAGIYIIAWLIGYLTPGSPGGIGVKEAIAVLLLGSAFSKDGILQVLIAVRLITTFADFIAYLADIIFNKQAKLEPEPTSPPNSPTEE